MTEEPETNGINEEQRQEMIAQGRDYLKVTDDLLDASEVRHNAAIDVINHEAMLSLSLKELKLTWMERLAMILGVNTSRFKEEKGIILVFADTDGDPVLEEEGDPSVTFDCFDDISRMVMSVPKKEEK
jgi:hypothetical protein